MKNLLTVTLTFDPVAARESGTFSGDSSNYSIKVPGYASRNQSKIDKLMKLGYAS